MIIRKARPEDYEVVAPLELAVYQLHYQARPDFFKLREEPLTRERFESMLSGSMLYLIAEIDGRPVGQATAFRREYKDHPVFCDIAWMELDDISVLPACQGKGVGRALFEAVKQEARRMDLHHLELCVWGFNQNARGFYEKLGMRSRIDRMEMEI